jgi:hypothetical protein
VEQDARLAHVGQVLDGQPDALADNAAHVDDRRSDQLGVQFEHRVRAEFRRQPLVRQFDSVTLDAGKGDLQRIPIRADRTYADRLFWSGGRRNHRLGGEVEGDAEHIGIFDIELVILVQIVGLTAQRAAHDLLQRSCVPKARTPRM